MFKSKIINGKRYDIRTAKVVGSYESTPMQSDFQYYKETLYRKRNGEFFLFGEGGPMSPYSKQGGQCEWGYGESIIPMDEDAAKEWAEVHLDGDRYEEIFGVVEE